MSFVTELLTAREKFDNGSIDVDRFMNHVNSILDRIQYEMTVEQKAEAFDKLADTVLDFLRLEKNKYEAKSDPEDGDFYIKGDFETYVSDAALEAVVGKDFFKFFNGTYNQS